MPAGENIITISKLGVRAPIQIVNSVDDAVILAALLDFMVAFVVFVIALIYYQIEIDFIKLIFE